MISGLLVSSILATGRLEALLTAADTVNPTWDRLAVLISNLHTLTNLIIRLLDESYTKAVVLGI